MNMRRKLQGARRCQAERRGAVLVLVTICLVALVGMVALAIDIGMIAVARGQCQNAADTSAMAGARTVSGNKDTNYNFAAVPGNAITAASQNKILNAWVKTDPSNVKTVNPYTYTSENVKVEAGAYTYLYDDANPAKEGFKIQIPRPDNTEPYSAVRVTVTNNNNYSFGQIFGMATFNTSATAVAVHRPRDVIIIMDLSGSMRFQSLPGIPYSGNRTTSMNPDPAYPQFGHYADTAGAALFGNSSLPAGTGEYYDPANIAVKTNSGPPILEDFYANPVGVSPGPGNRAFTRSSDSFATTPGGDNFLKITLNTGGTFARTVKQFNNDSTTTNPYFESIGYAHYNSTFNGYTEGPGYWGKTFFVWPPNPCGPNVLEAPSSLTNTTFNWHDNGSRDWRQRFFVAVKTSNSSPAWITHNTILFDSSGFLKTPGTVTAVTENGSSVNYTYRINYAAILHWLNQSPKHFPSTLQAGRIRYYTAIPDGTDKTLNNRWWTNNLSGLNNNERFWKEYIDFVLGFNQTGINTYNANPRKYIGNGDYYQWSGSTIQVSARPQPQPPSTNPSLPYMTGQTGPYQLSTTNPYQQVTTGQYQNGSINGSVSKGATTVKVNTLSLAPTANVNYVTFGSDTTVYKITNSSTTSLSISPSLAANMSSGTSLKIYSTNNAAGVNKVSVTNPPNTLTVNSDYIGFNNNSSPLYKVTGSTARSAGFELTLGSNLSSAINLNSATVQIYSSNGGTGANKMSVSTLPTSPTVNLDFIGFNNTTTNVYKITAVSNKNAGQELTLGAGLAAAVGVRNTSAQVYASDGSLGSTRISVTGLSQAPVVNRDYMIIGGDTANPYLITSAVSRSNGYILTVSPALAAAVDIKDATVAIHSPYMDYADDVRRPRHQLWFGPQTWVDWLGNYNNDKWGWPGNVHEAQAWACKVGIQTAIDDIKNNHPSDFIGLAFFSSPQYTSSGTGQHNKAIVPLGRNYQKLKDSLWFPPTTIIKGIKEITPYSADFANVPRAKGGTAPGMGFMIAYNLLSSSVDLRLHAQPQPDYRGSAGGLGRKGANRLIIFETDGVPNTRAHAAFVSSGKDSYYPIRVKNPEDLSDSGNEYPNSGTYNVNDIYSVVEQICKMETNASPGYSTTRKPVLIYPIGYGSLFDPNNKSTNQDNALNFMQNVAYRGNTAKTTTGTDFPNWQRIYGTNEERILRMQAAFTNIMQSGIQVSLIE